MNQFFFRGKKTDKSFHFAHELHEIYFFFSSFLWTTKSTRDSTCQNAENTLRRETWASAEGEEKRRKKSCCRARGAQKRGENTPTTKTWAHAGSLACRMKEIWISSSPLGSTVSFQAVVAQLTFFRVAFRSTTRRLLKIYEHEERDTRPNLTGMPNNDREGAELVALTTSLNFHLQCLCLFSTWIFEARTMCEGWDERAISADCWRGFMARGCHVAGRSSHDNLDGRASFQPHYPSCRPSLSSLNFVLKLTKFLSWPSELVIAWTIRAICVNSQEKKVENLSAFPGKLNSCKNFETFLDSWTRNSITKCLELTSKARHVNAFAFWHVRSTWKVQEFTRVRETFSNPETRNFSVENIKLSLAVRRRWKFL